MCARCRLCSAAGIARAARTAATRRRIRRRRRSRIRPRTPAPQFGVIGPAPNFTGNTGTLDPAGYTVGRRVFEAGARNATWHMHTAGQLVFGEAGRGRLQIQGQPIKELGVGESAFIPGGTYHWHGASPNENFTMMFITMGQSKTSQGEPVTEEVYLGK